MNFKGTKYYFSLPKMTQRKNFSLGTSVFVRANPCRPDQSDQSFSSSREAFPY